MKKLALTLAVALAFTGLVGVGASPATAAAYPGTVATKFAAVKGLPKTMKHGHRVIVTIKVAAQAGNARPSFGHVRVWIIRNGSIVNVVDNKVLNGTAIFKFRPGRAGHYKLVINYLPPRSSVYKFVSTTRFVTVR